jgi:hypothetical protein
VPSKLELTIAELKQGDHFCMIYRSPQEKFEAAVPFIQDGLARGEKCLYIAHQSADAIRKALLLHGVKVEREQENGALIFATESETYLRGGRFDPTQMCVFTGERLEAALRQGFAGLRTAGEMDWADGVDAGIHRAALLDYESKMAEFYASQRAIGMGQYAKYLFPEETLLEITRRHHLACMDGLVAENHCVRLRRENFFADILEDKHELGFHYVVQQDGAGEILAWGREPTLSQALASGEFSVAQLSEHAQRKARRAMRAERQEIV